MNKLKYFSSGFLTAILIVLIASSSLAFAYPNTVSAVISEIKIFGDYFFTKETAEIENLLVGTMHNYESVKSALIDIEISDYFSNISKEEFISILF